MDDPNPSVIYYFLGKVISIIVDPRITVINNCSFEDAFFWRTGKLVTTGVRCCSVTVLAMRAKVGYSILVVVFG